MKKYLRICILTGLAQLMFLNSSWAVDICELLTPAEGSIEWESVGYESFGNTLIILVDLSGTMANTVENCSRQYAQDYFKNVFGEKTTDPYPPDGQLVEWMQDLQVDEKVSFDWMTGKDRFLILGFGIEKQREDSWKNYLHADSYVNTEYDQPFNALIEMAGNYLKRKDSNAKLKNWGVASVATSMALTELGGCFSGKGDFEIPLSKKIYILLITDNGSNRGTGQLHEILAATRIGKIKDISYVSQAQLGTRDNYQFEQSVGMALFVPNRDKPETNLTRIANWETIDIRPFIATLYEVKPVIQPDPSKFFMPRKSITMAMYSEGRMGNLSLDIMRDENDGFKIRKLHIKMCDDNGKTIQEESRTAVGDGLTPGEITEIKLTDKRSEAEIGRNPGRVTIEAFYRYRPQNYDLGLVVKTNQIINVNYEKPITLPNGKRITREILGKYPGKSTQEIFNELRYQQERYEMYRLGIIVASVVLFFIFIFRMIGQYKRKFQKPQMKGELKEPEDTHDILIRKNILPIENCDNILRPVHYTFSINGNQSQQIIGYFSLRNDSKPNKQGEYERLNLDSINVSVSKCRPEVKFEEDLIQLNGMRRHENVPFTKSTQWVISVDITQLKNVNEVEFREIDEEYLQEGVIWIDGSILININHKKLKNREQSLSYNLTLPILVEPSPYEFTPEIYFDIGKEEIEYDRYGQDIRLGILCIRDQTISKYRKTASINIRVELKRLKEYESVKEEAIYLIHNEISEDYLEALQNDSDKWSADDIITLNENDRNELVYGKDGFELRDKKIMSNLELELWLNPKKLQPIYNRTKYSIEVSVFDKTKDNSPKFCQKSIIIYENQKEANLRVQYISHLLKHQGYKDWDDGDIISQAEGSSVKQGGAARDSILLIRVSNTALHPNSGESPTNYVQITKVRLEMEDPSEISNLVELRDYDGDRNYTLGDDILIGGAINLIPQKGDKNAHLFEVSVRTNADSQYFESKDELHQGAIYITYNIPSDIPFTEKPDERVEYEKKITFDFLLKPDYGTEVVAIDFGTSAIAIAQNTLNERDALVELIEMGNFWVNIYESGQDPVEEDHNYISSIIAYNKNEISRPFELAPPVQVVNLPGHNRSIIPFLKTYIGGCKGEIRLTEEEMSLKVRQLLNHAYTEIHSKYIEPARVNRDKYKRVILTHPNSFLDGQVGFLRQVYKEVLESYHYKYYDVKNISESDAVLYLYLKGEKTDIFPAPCPGEKETNKEYILCYDIGAGTVDISYRVATYKKSEVNGSSGIYVNFNQQDGEDDPIKLLGMASVNGAGNLLDEVIAEVIEEKLEIIETIYEDLAEDDPDLDNFMRIPLLVPLSDHTNHRSQKDALIKLHSRIEEAKRKVGENQKEFIISLTIGTENDILRFGSKKLFDTILDEISDMEDIDLSLPQGKDFTDSNELLLKIPFDEIESVLEKDFYRTQLYEPLDAVLIREEKNYEHVDTLLVTGRCAKFPGFCEKLAGYIKEKTKNNELKVIYPHSSKDMKSVVVEGATRWGISMIEGNESFSTPIMHGTICMVYKMRGGKWILKPLIYSSDVEKDLKSRKPKIDDKIMVEYYDVTMVLHTYISSTEWAQEKINEIADEYQNSKILKQRMEASGYFRVLWLIGETYKLETYGKELCFSLLPVRYGDGKLYDENQTQSEYLNIKVKVYLVNPLNNTRLKELESDTVGIGVPLTFKDFWPMKIFR